MKNIVAALFAFSLLAGCSTGSSNPGQATQELPTPDVQVTSAPVRNTPPRPTADQTEDPAVPQVSAEDLDGIAIDFWHVWSYDSGQALEDLVNEFNVTNPYGIRVEAVNQETYSDLSSSLEDSLRRAEGPNLTVGFNNQLRMWDNSWSIIRDLDDFVDDPDWGLTAEEQADFYPVFWEQDLAGGKRMGLPAQRSAQVLFYNRSWAEELGFETSPETLEEFQEQACAAAEHYR
ncbi:MAG TPA: hypothetical protein VJ768_04980, partial [Anaerolineales bacterium]|nr:hypothetical protein [Anaerolineales bacterium]